MHRCRQRHSATTGRCTCRWQPPGVARAGATLQPSSRSTAVFGRDRESTKKWRASGSPPKRSTRNRFLAKKIAPKKILYRFFVWKAFFCAFTAILHRFSTKRSWTISSASWWVQFNWTAVAYSFLPNRSYSSANASRSPAMSCVTSVGGTVRFLREGRNK